jgi:hypothetical protein
MPGRNLAPWIGSHCFNPRMLPRMDTFIVRIYRRVTRAVEEPAGTVEHVESGERAAFSDTRELLTRLIRRRRHGGPADKDDDRTDN